MSQKINLIHGDCLEEMAKLEPESIDMVICDPPYGTTAQYWDKIIPFNSMWINIEKLIKVKSAICLFGSDPFSTLIRYSKIEWFKYDWIWEKSRPSGFLHAKNKPLKNYEIISVFSKGTTVHDTQSKNRMNYYPIFSKGKPYKRLCKNASCGAVNHKPTKKNIEYINTLKINTGERYPTSILKFNMHNSKNYHPFQKPIKLYEYMIKTYSQENDTVLDFCMGSGTGAIACYNLNRNFIGIEKEKKYFDSANERLNKHRDT